MSHLIVPERTQLKRTDGLTTIVQTYITYLLFHYLLEQIAPDSHCCDLILSTSPFLFAGAGLRDDHVLGGQRRRTAAGAMCVPFDCRWQTGDALQLFPGQPDVRIAGGELWRR